MEYRGKILLFGEHIVVQGAQALAQPLLAFRGRWAFSLATALPTYSLQDWLPYLYDLQSTAALGVRLDLVRFERDLREGLWFDSNIPLGYGAGSSGALCAALYDTYALNPPDKTDSRLFPAIKADLGKIESYFHGASSGADPLVSYLDQPLLFDGGQAIRPVSLPMPDPRYTLFLLDTGHARKTGPLVQQFQAKMREPHFRDRVVAELIPATEEAIQCYIQGSWEALFEVWTLISHFQYRFMSEWILPGWQRAWLDSLAGPQQRLKICGAGGGGFILGITCDWSFTLAAFGEKAIPL
jgi:mevalonate kinase